MAKRTCSVEGCEKPMHVAAGWCNMHYWRMKKHGSVDPELQRKPRQGLPCVIDGCERERYSGKHGWCKLHYDRWRRHGDPHKVLIEMPAGGRADRIPRSELDCAVTGCERPVLARGWCNVHYGRWLKTGDPGPVEIGQPGRPLTPTSLRCAIRGCRRRKSMEAGGDYCREHAGLPPVPVYDECTVEGCGKPHASHGFCVKHRYRFLRYGDPQVVKVRHGSGDDISYVGAHARVRSLRGSASGYDCIDCGSQARDWSYNHTDENEKWEAGKGPYSPDPDCYEPRCRPCHIAFDAEYARNAS